MRNFITLLMLVCCSLFSKGDCNFQVIYKGDSNLQVIKNNSKIYYLGNDSIGWCTFYDDGSLISRLTDIRPGYYKTQCPFDCDDLVYKYQGHDCTYLRTDSTLVYKISVLYWIDDFSSDGICDVYKTTYNRLIYDVYNDIYNKILEDLNLSACSIEVKHIDRNKFCKLLTNSEEAIELELLRTNNERLHDKHTDEINTQTKVSNDASYVLNFSDIEDNMVAAELIDKYNFVLSSYLFILDNRGYIKTIKRIHANYPKYNKYVRQQLDNIPQNSYEATKDNIQTFVDQLKTRIKVNPKKKRDLGTP